MENDTFHTKWLSEKDANEMLERYTRIFPDLQFCIVYIEKF